MFTFGWPLFASRRFEKHFPRPVRVRRGVKRKNPGQQAALGRGLSHDLRDSTTVAGALIIQAECGTGVKQKPRPVGELTGAGLLVREGDVQPSYTTTQAAESPVSQMESHGHWYLIVK
jgi:hypothetical protein